MFEKYQHIERLGNTEVEGIEMGECWVFPKIDGTNSQVWMEGDSIKAGSRNRELSLDNDNAGFLAYVVKQPNLIKFAVDNPTFKIFGEWLVPHSLKTYRQDAWKRFYIFDVMKGEKYLTYDEYQPYMEEYKLEYIPPICKITNGNYNNFIHALNQNNFLIEDGKGIGEGIVIKNYNFVNKFGRTTWAKIVTSEFKEKNLKAMGCPEIITNYVEEKIVDSLLTKAMIEKEYEKIKLENDGWNSKLIPQLFGRMFYSFVTEEIWNVVKEFKNPTVDFRKLNNFIILKIKKEMQELF